MRLAGIGRGEQASGLEDDHPSLRGESSALPARTPARSVPIRRAGHASCSSFAKPRDERSSPKSNRTAADSWAAPSRGRRGSPHGRADAAQLSVPNQTMRQPAVTRVAMTGCIRCERRVRCERQAFGGACRNGETPTMGRPGRPMRAATVVGTHVDGTGCARYRPQCRCSHTRCRTIHQVVDRRNRSTVRGRMIGPDGYGHRCPSRVRAAPANDQGRRHFLGAPGHDRTTQPCASVWAHAGADARALWRRAGADVASGDAVRRPVTVSRQVGRRLSIRWQGMGGREGDPRRHTRRGVLQLADTIVDDFDVIELLTMMSGRCVELLDASSAGILLADVRGILSVVAASSEEATLLELFQLQNKQGPASTRSVPVRRSSTRIWPSKVRGPASRARRSRLASIGSRVPDAVA